MRAVFAGMLVAACALSTTALAQLAASERPSPQWVKTPSATLDPLSWPERALRLEVDGQATLQCAYDAKGALSDCRVVSETPSNFGFGLASLRMVKVFMLKPTLSDGSALSPGAITFSVDFVAAEFRDPRRTQRAGQSFSQAQSSTNSAQVVWLTPPSGGSNWRDWPAPALRLEISGNATLKCNHDDQGRLNGCEVTEQSRPDKGFGEAALRLAKTFRLRPTLSDGSPLTAGQITFKVPFDYERLQ